MKNISPVVVVALGVSIALYYAMSPAVPVNPAVSVNLAVPVNQAVSVKATALKTALVGFHNRSYYDKTPHWLREEIDLICKDQGIDRVLTADINASTFDTPCDIVADMFSEEFYVKYSKAFDMVFLPDGGGRWFSLQEKRAYRMFIDMVEQFKRLLKPGGTLFISKITVDKEKLVDLLLLREFQPYIPRTDMGKASGIILLYLHSL